MIHLRPSGMATMKKHGPFYGYFASSGLGPALTKEQLRRGVFLAAIAAVLILVGSILTWLVIGAVMVTVQEQPLVSTEVFGSMVPILGPLIMAIGILLMILSIRQFYIVWRHKHSSTTSDEANVEAQEKDLDRKSSLAARCGVTFKSTANSNTTDTELASTSKSREWFEVKSPEGYFYYWNTTTNESMWDPPEEYVSLAEQEGLTEQVSNSMQQATNEKSAEEEEKEEEIGTEDPERILHVDPVGTREAAFETRQTIPPDLAFKPEPQLPCEPTAVEYIPLPGEIPSSNSISLHGIVAHNQQPQSVKKNQPMERNS